MKQSEPARTPEIVVAIGARIRAARIAAGMSQGALGATVGVSYQQIQKYENGRNRIAADILQEFAQALDVHPGSFFDVDLPVLSRGARPAGSAAAVAADWQRIEEPETRKRLASLISAFAEEIPAEPKSEG